MNQELYFHNQETWVEALLCDMIAIPSTRGKEAEVHRLLAKCLDGFVDDCRLIPVPHCIVDDPEYSLPDPDLRYRGKNNLRIAVGGGPKTVILNSHTDVVPPSTGQTNAFAPRCADGIVHGRGACDAKGQVAVIALVLKAIAELGCPSVQVVVHIVSEEESGGNGTLALVRQEAAADMAVVLEPTQLQILPSVRGAVWFEATLWGSSAHAGNARKEDSAICAGMAYIAMMERYHQQLVRKSMDYGLFVGMERALPLTFGTFQAGSWASTVPDKAVITGVMGLLPNMTADSVIGEIAAELAKPENAALQPKLEITYPYRHDAVETDPSHPLVQGLVESCRLVGVNTNVSAMGASCDAVFYQKLMGIPVAVFGPGSLSFAHTAEEQIRVKDIVAAAQVLYQFLCGMDGVAN